MVLGPVLWGLGLYEVIVQANETEERHTLYKWSRDYCNSVEKQLLQVGMRRHWFNPPEGDVTLDIDPAVLSVKGGVVGDVRNMSMFGDKEFGTVICSHVLEHLHSVDDIELAISESVRVADRSVFIAPSPYSIMAMLHPQHRFRLWFSDNTIKVLPNEWSIGQSMTTNETPKVIDMSRTFIVE